LHNLVDIEPSAANNRRIMTNNLYSQTLIKNASSLDDLTSSNGVILRCALEIVQNADEKATQRICAIINRIIDSDFNKEVKLQARELKDSVVRHYGHLRLVDICNTNEAIPEENEKSLKQLVTELNELVGLESVKQKVKNLVAFQQIQLLRKEKGLTSPKRTLHLSFTGNPGTGKTTVARIVGRIYKQLGLLSKGHFIEASRTDLIAGYQGQTALKVKAVIEKAKGGVLFIDEAYSITENEHTDSYGRECLTELTKALEDYRDDLVVIVAGYTQPMKKFFESNPGLKSRFNTFIEFEDYNTEELTQMLCKMCQNEDYDLDQSALTTIKSSIDRIILQKECQFANGRFIRNLFEDMIMNHAQRVNTQASPSLTDLKTLLQADIPKSLI
jgi:SpoVK/Ycf46/Vps4 family AAA+-type ATPase